MTTELRTIDLTDFDYAFTPHDRGHFGRISCWTVPAGGKPNVGDMLILRNGDRSSRYLVEDTNLCLNVDPPTMWMSSLRFHPRTA